MILSETPWTIGECGDVYSAADFCVATVWEEADARLIAASPEMYAALKAADAFICEFSGPRTDKLKSQIAAAIAKAEGNP